MRFDWFLVIGLTVLVWCLSAAHTKAANSNDGKQEVQELKPRLFRILDFAKFKLLFEKSYKSLVEEMSRMRLFLARCYKSFVSVLQFKKGHSSSYKSINQMSDWTAEEYRATLMQRDMVRLANTTKMDEELANVAVKQEDEESIELAAEHEAWGISSEQDVVRKMVEAAKSFASSGQHVDDSLKELTDGPTSPRLFRQKRELAVARPLIEKRAWDVADLMGGVVSQFDRMEHLDETKLKTSNEVRLLVNERDKNEFFVQSGNLPPEKPIKKRAKQKLLDETVLYVDHRNCFNEPVNQQKCGSCYNFAAISVLEYHYCMTTGEQVKFSEQFPLDCSSEGCGGGVPQTVIDFSVQYGVERAHVYPYFVRRKKCYFDTDPHRLGYWHISGLSQRYVTHDELDEALEQGPVLIMVYVSNAFREYGGGVDELECVEGENLHAMTLVGEGREGGKDFWLIRNSYSIYWGEDGNYKVSKSSFKTCYFENEYNGLVVEGAIKFRRNRKYDGELMSKLEHKWNERLHAKRNG